MQKKKWRNEILKFKQFIDCHDENNIKFKRSFYKILKTPMLINKRTNCAIVGFRKMGLVYYDIVKKLNLNLYVCDLSIKEI